MTETKMEQRLREIAHYVSPPYTTNVTLSPEDAAAIDAGREALALLREWNAIDDGAGRHSEVKYAEAIDHWKDALLALLARAEEP